MSTYFRTSSNKKVSLIFSLIVFLVLIIQGNNRQSQESNAEKLAQSTLKPTYTPSTNPQIATSDAQLHSATVTRIVDGDTIKVLLDGKTETVRLIGIDTPESVDPRKPAQCFSHEASHKAQGLMLNKHVLLQEDPTQNNRDKYNRLLRYVFLNDGTFVNKVMISDGYAFEYIYRTPYVHQTEFKKAEADARIFKRGMWGDEGCVSIAPAAF